MDWKDSDDSLTEFTLAEIVEMSNLFKEVGENCLDQEFCQDVASNFSSSASRYGKSAITWQEVHGWFLERKRQKELLRKPASSCGGLNLCVDLSGPKVHYKAPEIPKKLKGRAVDLTDLRFEAKSAKDAAWYDVASFVTYRVLCTGDLEARVRFAGFNNKDDEWVNVRHGIRERSIPLEPSECHRVKVGDLVLCFQERFEQAVYCDAHVVEIQRRLHDLRGCRCIFVVHYDHDNSEERVELERICCRPKQQQIQQQPAIDFSSYLEIPTKLVANTTTKEVFQNSLV